MQNDVMKYAQRPLSELRITDPSFSNPRTFTGLAPSDIRELALEIFRGGLRIPMLVTEDGLVIAGSRRFRALTLLTRWRDDLELYAALTEDIPYGPQLASIDDRIGEIVRAVPVFVIWHSVSDREGLARLEGIALADNLHRADLSTYEVAARLVTLHAGGATGVQIARLIGKSPSYVSRKLSTWRHACPELRSAWRDGMPEDTVEVLSKVPLEDQLKALSEPVPRGRRGPTHRPSVDSVRDVLLDLDQRPQPPASVLAKQGAPAIDWAYLSGARDALRWATGAQAGAEFAKLVEPSG